MTPEGKIISHAKKESRSLGLRFVRLSFGPGVETGWPDCIILGPEGVNGEVLWMETKAPGKPLRPIQEHRRGEILSRGGKHVKPDTKEDVTSALESFKQQCILGMRVWEESAHNA